MSLTLLIVLSMVIGTSMGFSGIGGFLVVPLMIILGDTTPAQAVFTALAANLGVTLSNGVFAMRRGQIDWHIFRYLVMGSVVGALAGAGLISVLSLVAARFVIAAFLVGLGVVSLRPRRMRVGSPERALSRMGVALLGIGAQASAVMAGIGGPAVTVPILASRGACSERVVGTALLHGAIVSGLGLVVTGVVGASASWLVLGVAILIVISSLLASIWRARILKLVSIRHFVGALALLAAAVLLFLT